MHGGNSETALGHNAAEQSRIRTKSKKTGVRHEVGGDKRRLGALRGVGSTETRRIGGFEESVKHREEQKYEEVVT